MKLKRLFNIVAAVTAAGILSAGCGSSLFTSREHNPIVKDEFSTESLYNILGNKAKLGIFGMGADRRLLMVLPEDNGAKICAEPSPDAATELSRKLATALEAQVAQAGQGKASINSETIAKLSLLFKRSQGLQLFRDGMYATCQDFINKAITPDQVNQRFDKLLEAARQLIEIEVKNGAVTPAETTPATPR